MSSGVSKVRVEMVSRCVVRRDDEAAYAASLLVELEAERASVAEYLRERKPYWLGVRQPRDGALRWELWNNAAVGHYYLSIVAVRYRLEDVWPAEDVDELVE